MTELTTLIFAVFGGILPALFWLWFWLKEDREHPEPRGKIAASFLVGMGAVFLALPLEHIACSFIVNSPCSSMSRLTHSFISSRSRWDSLRWKIRSTFLISPPIRVLRWGLSMEISALSGQRFFTSP